VWESCCCVGGRCSKGMAAAGYEIPLDLKINFLENVVIPSFSPRLPHAGNEEAREIWIQERFHIFFKEHSDEDLNELLLLFHTITTVVEARHERDQILQRQTSKSIFDIYFSIHFYSLTPSIVSPLHPFSRYQFPAQHAFT
jgi:hypothetical protein